MEAEARENERKRDEDDTLLVLKTEEGATSQRMPAASGSWKCQRKRLSLEPPEGMQPYQHLDFSPLRPILEFRTQEL